MQQRIRILATIVASLWVPACAKAGAEDGQTAGGEHTAASQEQETAEKGQGADVRCANVAWCLTNVTRAKLEAAKRALSAWESREKTRAYFASPALSMLPLDETILEPRPTGMARTPGVHGNAWGHSSILYTIRRAAYFTQQLFPQLRAITVLRVNTSNPPPASSPMDMHTNGRCADIGYILTGDGNDPAATVDLERTFWFAYAVRSAPDFFQMLTDFKDEMLSYRTLAVESGLIAASEFLDRDLMADRGMNHDTHLHVGVSR